MNTLIVITGPTGSGKSDLAVELAETLGTEIIGADSRQLYRGIPIATAAPTPEQQARVKHHLVQTLQLTDYYSAALFEEQALDILQNLFATHSHVVMCGGSMMYIDAVTHGIDPLPTISPEIRAHALSLYQEGGLAALHQTLQQIDPEYLLDCDPSNHRRLIHAIEITMQAGVPCSTLRTGQAKPRPFRTIKIAINHTRPQLFDRINRRVDKMIQAGLEKEARSLYHLRHLNSLNTVGLKEIFAHIDGLMDRETAIARIAKNTRVYAKKQLLWLSKDPSVHLLDPTQPLLPQALNCIL